MHRMAASSERLRKLPFIEQVNMTIQAAIRVGPVTHIHDLALYAAIYFSCGQDHNLHSQSHPSISAHAAHQPA